MLKLDLGGQRYLQLSIKYKLFSSLKGLFCFKPNSTISRAEMVTIIARVMNLYVLMTSEVISYTDVSSSLP